MAFTHDSSTDEGLLRTLVNDTDSTDYEFEDDELTNILSLNSDDLWRSAADLCRALAAKYSKKAMELSLGKMDISIDLKKKAAYFLQLAGMYDSRSGSDVVEHIDSFAYGIGFDGGDNSEYIGDDT